MLIPQEYFHGFIFNCVHAFADSRISCSLQLRAHMMPVNKILKLNSKISVNETFTETVSV